MTKMNPNGRQAIAGTMDGIIRVFDFEVGSPQIAGGEVPDVNVPLLHRLRSRF